MQESTENRRVFPHVAVQLTTVQWQGIEDTPAYPGYNLSQRLSDNHAPLRVGNVSIPEVMPRVRSVGLLPPGRPVRLFPVEEPLRVVHCLFEEDFFESTTEISRQQWEEHTPSLMIIRNRRLELLMQDIQSELEQPGFGNDLLLEATSSIVLVELARYLRQVEQKKQRPCGEPALAPWQLRRIHERLQAAPDIGYPGLTELAVLCGISSGHLTRAFKTTTGWQLHKYIAELRLEAAKDLLLDDQLSCDDIACRLGFKSQAYFSTAFRRLAGKTPTEYRQAKKQSDTWTKKRR